MAITAASLAIACGVFGFAAIQTLGRQWSLVARVTEEHRLITSGPYAFVRHPIYTAILGLLIATGICLTRPLVTAVAVVVYLIGTALRTRSEERLLIDAFGDAYREYARRVGGIIPRFGISARGSAR